MEIEIDLTPEVDATLSIDERQLIYADAAKSLRIHSAYFDELLLLEELEQQKQLDRTKPELVSLKYSKLFRFMRGGQLSHGKPVASTVASTTGPRLIHGVAELPQVSEDNDIDVFIRRFMPGRISGAAEVSDIPINVSGADLETSAGNMFRVDGGATPTAIKVVAAKPELNSLTMRLIGSWRRGIYGAEYLANQIMWSTEMPFFKTNLAELANKDGLIELGNAAAEAADSVTSLIEYTNDRHRAYFWAEFMHMLENLPEGFNPKKASDLYQLLRIVVAIRPSIDTIESVDDKAEHAVWRPIIDVLKSITSISDTGPMGQLFDAQAANVFTEWLFAAYLTLDQSADETMKARLKSFLAQSAKRRDHMKTARIKEQSVRLAALDEKIIEHTLRWHYINKFGWDAYIALPGAPQVSSADTSTWRLFDHIPTNEQKLINLLVKKEEAARADDAKPAPWKKLVAELRVENDRTKRQIIYNELKKYLPAPTKGKLEWLRSTDGRIILCPHVRDQLELEANERNSEAVLHEHLLKYAGNTPLQDAYYCNICGETLTYNEQLTTAPEEAQAIDATEALRDFIWRQASYIVKSQLQFKLATTEYINRFITSIVSAIYDTIALAERKIRRIKTATLEDSENRLRLYTIIYIWAFLIKTVAENPNIVHFGPTVTGEERKRGGDDCDIETIGDDFGVQNVEVRGGGKHNDTAALISAVVKAFMSIHNVLLQKLRDVNEQFIREQIQLAFVAINKGMTRADLRPMAPLDRTSLEKIDPLWLYLNNPPVADGHPKGAELDKYNEYRKLSYERFVYYEKSNGGREPVFRVVWTAGTGTVAPGEYWVKYRADPEQIRMRELEAHFNPYMRKIRHYMLSPQPFKASNRYNDRPYPPWLLARTYGKFHKHKWNTYVYVSEHDYKGDGVAKYKPDKLIKAEKMADNQTIVDRICTVCNATHSEMCAAGPATAKTGEWMAAEDTLTSFFNYYQQRCPELSPTDEHPSHVWTASGCSKCGVTKENLVSRDLKYFDKYKAAFAAVARAGPVLDLVQPAVPDVKIAELWHADDTIANPNMSMIQEISKFPLTYKPAEYRNLWMNLGLTEDLEYDDIKSGKVNPASDKIIAVSDTRIRKLRAYMEELNFDINTLMNHRQMSTLSPEMAAVVAAIKKQDSLDELVAISSEIETSLTSNVHPLDLLIKWLLKVYAQLQDSGAANAFLRYFVEKIFMAEELAGKMRERKQAAVEATNAADTRYDPNMQDHTQSNSFDGLAGEVDKFSYKHMDYNGYNE